MALVKTAKEWDGPKTPREGASKAATGETASADEQNQREPPPVVYPVTAFPMADSGQLPAARAANPALTPAQQRWVDKTLSRLSLREKLGQMLMAQACGVFLPRGSAEYRRVAREVEEHQVGGFLLGTQQTAAGVQMSRAYASGILINDLQRRAAVPLFFSADFEQGAGMRLVEGTHFPSAMAVAAAGNPEDGYTTGHITALEARAVGVNWIFAPVADVNVNPDNPIVNIRSYGENPVRVAEFVAQVIRGIQENGALATAKHFPGHGDVTQDSHLVLPCVRGDRRRLESVEWVPFRAAIAAGVRAIMTGHLAVPAVEPDTGIPATLSAHVLQGVLRGELGFRGLIVADALDMGGVTSLYSPTEAAVRAAIAGVDVLLMPSHSRAALIALEDAVHTGRLPESRIDEAVRRILEAKAHLGLAERDNQTDLSALSDKLRRHEFITASRDIAARGITLLRNSQNLIPLDAAKPSRIQLLALSGDPDTNHGEEFEAELRRWTDSLTVLRADTQFTPVRTLEIPSADQYDVVIVVLFVRVSDRKGTVDLPDDHTALVRRLLAGSKPVIMGCFGNPYLIERFPEAETWLAAFSSVGGTQRAAARALFGHSAIQGRLPVSIPGVAEIGAGLQLDARPAKLQPAPASLIRRLEPAFEILNSAVRERAFPGAALAVGFQNQLALRAFGRVTYDKDSPAVDDEAIYDVASLTKPIVTTTAVMILRNEGQIALDAPVSRYLHEWASGPESARRRAGTVRDLLLHTSGLPAHRHFYRDVKDKFGMLARIFAEPLTSKPGARIKYSDLGFILLGEIVERITGEPLDAFAAERIFKPLEMSRTFFNPPNALRGNIAPTEDDQAFRHRLLHGEVHDGNAWAMGGIAGHAGLFSTACDLAVFAQMMLNGGIYGGARLLSHSAIEEFTQRRSIGDNARALGWDVPTAPSSSGQYFFAESYGHTGYTGASLWIDPRRALFVALLTNRVHPSASNERIREVRPALHDAIVEALGLTTAGGR